MGETSIVFKPSPVTLADLHCEHIVATAYAGDQMQKLMDAYILNVMAWLNDSPFYVMEDVECLIAEIENLICPDRGSQKGPRERIDDWRRTFAAYVGRRIMKGYHVTWQEFFQIDAVVPPLSENCIVLARSIKDGNDCGFALHDALAENGCWLAEHFSKYPQHSPDCWAAMMIGRK